MMIVIQVLTQKLCWISRFFWFFPHAVSLLHFVAKICAEYWLKSVPNIARYFTENIPVRRDILPTHPSFCIRTSYRAHSPSVHQPCASTRHQLWHHQKVQIDKHHWHQYWNWNNFLFLLIVGLRTYLPINYFNVGEYLAFKRIEFFDNQQKRTNLFQVLSEAKFAPLLSLLDFTSIQISNTMMRHCRKTDSAKGKVAIKQSKLWLGGGQES